MGKRGFPGTLTQESTFLNQFCAETQVTDKIIQKNQNIEHREKKIENWTYGYKMAAKILISNSRHKISHQKWGKKHFFEEIFPWNFAHKWRLQIQLHCWKKNCKKLFGCALTLKSSRGGGPYVKSVFAKWSYFHRPSMTLSNFTLRFFWW